jgi:hypothetical protein
VGSEALLGATPVVTTTTVGADVAVGDPAEFDAVTATRIVAPTSAITSVYVCPLAPAIDVQLPPPVSQRSHWYAYAIGAVPVQLPVDALSTCPCCAFPEIVGSAVFTGGAAATTAVAADTAVSERSFEAVTVTRTVAPTAVDTKEYVCPVAPAISAQLPPVASQRRHW